VRRTSPSSPAFVASTRCLPTIASLGANCQLSQSISTPARSCTGTIAPIGRLSPFELSGQIRPSATLKLLYGTAYLAPSPYQGYAHYGSFISTDGGATFSSPYWHLPNPGLKPQLKKTAEATVNQRLGPNLNLSASTFYSRFTNLMWASDAPQAYAGFYHGWPVDYIDFPVNQGRETTYGGTFQLEAMKSFAPDRQFAAHAGLSVVLAVAFATIPRRGLNVPP